MKSDLKHCPSCGSTKIRRVKEDWTGEADGRVYVVPDVEFDECPDCKERVFDKSAVRKIQAKSPAFRKHARRQAA